jgi:methylmalonyl-CoA/ethylmalonyl-CoA epimerase
MTTDRRVAELRVSITVADFDLLRQLFGDALGMTELQSWETSGRGVVLDAGRATLELLDEEHSRHVDEVEGGSPPAGGVRLALQVPDVEAAAARATELGAATPSGPRPTPWGDLNIRVVPPEGPQLTLYTPATPATHDEAAGS